MPYGFIDRGKFKPKALTMKLARPSTEVNELLRLIKKANGKSKFVQVLDAESVINRIHLLGAYANSVIAFENKTNRTNSVAMEMLLFAAMTDQIENAIDLCGAKDDSDLVFFSNSAALYNRIKPYLKNISDFIPDRNHVKKTAKKYGINVGGKKMLDASILERIAISRLSFG